MKPSPRPDSATRIRNSIDSARKQFDDQNKSLQERAASLIKSDDKLEKTNYNVSNNMKVRGLNVSKSEPLEALVAAKSPKKGVRSASSPNPTFSPSHPNSLRQGSNSEADLDLAQYLAVTGEQRGQSFMTVPSSCGEDSDSDCGDVAVGIGYEDPIQASRRVTQEHRYHQLKSKMDNNIKEERERVKSLDGTTDLAMAKKPTKAKVTSEAKRPTFESNLADIEELMKLKKPKKGGRKKSKKIVAGSASASASASVSASATPQVSNTPTSNEDRSLVMLPMPVTPTAAGHLSLSSGGHSTGDGTEIRRGSTESSAENHKVSIPSVEMEVTSLKSTGAVENSVVTKESPSEDAHPDSNGADSSVKAGGEIGEPDAERKESADVESETPADFGSLLGLPSYEVKGPVRTRNGMVGVKKQSETDVFLAQLAFAQLAVRSATNKPGVLRSTVTHKQRTAGGSLIPSFSAHFTVNTQREPFQHGVPDVSIQLLDSNEYPATPIFACIFCTDDKFTAPPTQNDVKAIANRRIGKETFVRIVCHRTNDPKKRTSGLVEVEVELMTRWNMQAKNLFEDSIVEMPQLENHIIHLEKIKAES